MRKVIFFLLLVIVCIFSWYGDIDRPVKKSTLFGSDYRLYQGTAVWPLAKAAFNKNYDEVESILKANPELANIPDSAYGGTMLTVAIHRQDYKLFKILLDNGADVNHHDKLNDASQLIQTCRYKGYELRFARDLIDRGALVNDTSRKVGTPLLCAAEHSTVPFVKLLLENGADINYRTPIGSTVLSNALAVDNYDVALFLLESGADYNSPQTILSPGQGRPNPDTVYFYILDELRLQTPRLGSSDFAKKKKIIEFLKQRGLDYYAEPIPPHMIREIKSKYPDTWEEYLKVY